MEPITLIVAALGAGLTVAVTQASKDLYENLKSLLGTRFGKKPEHAAALASFEKDPEHGAAKLAAAVGESGAQHDPEVLAAANTLLAEADPGGDVARKYSLLIQGNVQGLVQGDHNTVTMTFGDTEPKTEPKT